MLSADGRCKAFSRHANGYVRGEGVGMLVLKKLKAAERDGDHIYGVIRGSAENHGGRAQSLTAPNPKAQAELLKAAYGRAGIDPRTVGYIEAHGTGTELGDPIEINGLKSAFRDLFEASGGSSSGQAYCGLGTVKSNIGHLELAAGVAGMIKVLLQLQHKTLVKSLHCEELNPYIQLEDSPFYVVRETQPWRPMQDAQGRDLPRRAGVSSFGFGGVNAHVVIEEYMPRTDAARSSVAVSTSRPALVVLSAKNEERLKEQAEQLVAAIEQRPLGDEDLADIAYTLQVGREAMEYRLGVIAGSVAQLVSKLRRYLTDESGIEELYIGEIKREKNALAAFAADEDMARAINSWIAKGKHGKLLELWVKGLSFDWPRLYGEVKPRRIPLPTYPFAKERYWVESVAWPAGVVTDKSEGDETAIEAPQIRDTSEVFAEAEPEGVPALPEGGGRYRGGRAELKGLSIAQCVTWDVAGQVSEVLKLSRERLDAEENLADFGFDSIGLAELARRLSRHYGVEISPSVFFSHPTLSQLTQYFVGVHPGVVGALYREAEAAPSAIAARPGTGRIAARPKQARAVAAAASNNAVAESIAIIGMSGRFPKARTVEEMWRILEAGEDAVEEIPADRFDWRPYYGDPLGEPNKTDCKWGGFVPGVGEFDPLFFEISPREAELMDPRQRLLLMESWKALEDAGYGPAQLGASKVGMFVGVEQGDYQLLTRGSGSITSSHDGILASRLGYFLNMRGPAMAINTACSSALVALHQACLSLRSGECDTALAAGANLMLTPYGYIGTSQAGMLSKDGKCHAFDRAANGMVPGEAIAVVVLKRLSQAEADGDPIRAVIRGSGINYDGKTNGITAPSGASQASLLRDVYDRHGVNPEEIDYIVTHGTGTRLGDPVEINALSEAFKGYTQRQGFCALTFSKTNFGHTLAASGLVSLIGLVQSLRHETVPASLHCEAENDYIDWQASAFYVNKANKAWPEKADGKARTGAVSAFGMSGTNAHVVVESYRPTQAPDDAALEPPCYLLVLSAKTEAALQRRIEDLIVALEQRDWPAAGLVAMSHTLLCGRQHFSHRCALVAQDREAALHGLKQAARGERTAILFQAAVARHFAPQKALQGYGNELLGRCDGLLDDAASYQETLSALADLYCQGYDLAWHNLHKSANPRRIPLPTYPFATERYWVETSADVAEAVAGGPDDTTDDKPASDGSARSDAAEAFELLTFAEAWEEQALAAGPDRKMRRVVCFLSDAQSRRGVVEMIGKLAPRTEVVFVAQDSAEPDHDAQGHCYRVSRGEGASYRQALSRIRAAHGEVDAVLYLWALEDASCLQDPVIVAHLLQAMAASGLRCDRLLLAGAFGDGLERCHLESWIGFERSLGLVWPQTRVAVIGHERGLAVDQWLPPLWSELRAEQVASAFYREGKRWVCRVRPRPLEESESLLRMGGTYVISGGCGGLGLLVAQHLARTRTANLILLGRTALDDPKRQAIAALEALGSAVMYVQADVCDRLAIAEGLRAGELRFGALHGVIHAAGISGGESVFEKDAGRFNEVLAPKITGTLVLDEALGERALDFVCYFSSAAAMLGDFGSCDYAIGNRFLMAHAHYRNQRRGRGERQGKAVVINWGLWQDGGMGVGGSQATRLYLKSSGQRALASSEGVEVFERLLGQVAAQHLVLAGQPSRVYRFLGLEQPASDAERSSPEGGGRYRGGRAELKGLSIAQCVTWDVAGQVSEVLKLSRERLDAEENLADFGFDSIGLAELARRLSRHYGVEISPSVFFSHPTLSQLTQYFVGVHPGVVGALYREAEAAPSAIAARPGTGRIAARPKQARAVAAAASNNAVAEFDRDHRDERSLPEGADGGGDVADTRGRRGRG